MSKIPNGHEIISLFESMYPKHLAMEGDKDWLADWSA